VALPSTVTVGAVGEGEGEGDDCAGETPEVDAGALDDVGVHPETTKATATKAAAAPRVSDQE
jgi:hypothetical protein